MLFEKEVVFIKDPVTISMLFAHDQAIRPYLTRLDAFQHKDYHLVPLCNATLKARPQCESHTTAPTSKQWESCSVANSGGTRIPLQRSRPGHACSAKRKPHPAQVRRTRLPRDSVLRKRTMDQSNGTLSYQMTPEKIHSYWHLHW